MACPVSTEVPDRETVTVPAVLWIISDPDIEPLGCVGLKARSIAQTESGASMPPQAEGPNGYCDTNANSEVVSMLLMVTGEFPGLLTSTSSLSLVVPSS